MKILKKEDIEPGKIYRGINTDLLILATQNQKKDTLLFKGVVLYSSKVFKVGTYSKTWSIAAFESTNLRLNNKQIKTIEKG